MKDQHQEFDLILVSGETSPVRRFRLTRQRIRAVIITAAALGLVLLIGIADYVRLRIDAVDVEALRAQTAKQQTEVGGLMAQVDSLSAHFAALTELERKIRVIANLPGNEDEAKVPELNGRGGAIEEGGQGDAGFDVDPGAGTVPAAFDAEASGEMPELSGLDAPSAEGLIVKAIADADVLESAIAPRRESLEQLVAGLEGKRRQLESTPSIWPTDGWVTSRYGNRTSPFTGKKQFHGGIDIAAGFGTPIIAPAHGRVSYVGMKGPLGRTVIIDHGFGLKTTYGHTAKTYVERGEVVDRGTPIAAVGSTGRSTGPHLHYAIEHEGRAVNPDDYIFE